MPAGRKRFEPTEQQRRMIETLAGYGTKQDAIARIMGIDPKTLRRYFRTQLDCGADKANAQVAGTAFTMATSGKHPLMTKLWLQARNKWRVTSRLEYALDEERPLSIAAARAAIAEARLSRPKEDEDEEPITE